MESQFYILKEGKRRGPYSVEELQLMRIQKMDLIALSENSAWTEAYKIKELNTFFEEKETPPSSTAMPVKVDQYNNSPFGFGSGLIEFLQNGTIKIEYPSEVVYYRYANFGERFVARVLDLIIVFIPSLMMPLIAAWLYYGLQHSGENQQTLGQRALDLKLINANGRKVEFGQATGRFFGNFLNGITFGIGFILLFFSSKNQCLHDMLANTIVVSELKREKK